MDLPWGADPITPGVDVDVSPSRTVVGEEGADFGVVTDTGYPIRSTRRVLTGRITAIRD
ncbi:hypothetical protein ACFVHB_08955 [Kitasatospora sp. NPDC127111]|uniref:hypothetical protein n=1 Tax=Kitasatospora sp. NPDC127111 TaxID=3345363 RepID=UPI003642BD4D